MLSSHCTDSTLVSIQVAKILKKSESERTTEEMAVLLRHGDTVDELSKRTVRNNVLKRKLEEVCGPASYPLFKN